jgi:hypothetical protein
MEVGIHDEVLGHIGRGAVYATLPLEAIEFTEDAVNAVEHPSSKSILGATWSGEKILIAISGNPLAIAGAILVDIIRWQMQAEQEMHELEAKVDDVKVSMDKLVWAINDPYLYSALACEGARANVCLPMPGPDEVSPQAKDYLRRLESDREVAAWAHGIYPWEQPRLPEQRSWLPVVPPVPGEAFGRRLQHRLGPSTVVGNLALVIGSSRRGVGNLR